jgi:hypothetical protein
MPTQKCDVSVRKEGRDLTVSIDMSVIPHSRKIPDVISSRRRAFASFPKPASNIGTVSNEMERSVRDFNGQDELIDHY